MSLSLSKTFPHTRKYLFLPFLIFLFSGHVLHAQVWNYDFGGNNDFYDAPGMNYSFLPPASDGVSFISIGNGHGSYVLDNPGSSLGSGSELVAYGSNTTDINKFGVYGYSGGSTSYVKFNMRLSNNSAGSWYFYCGSGSSFTNNAPVDANDAFTGIKWSFDNSGAIKAYVHQNSGWSSFHGGVFNQDEDITIEVYSNNTDEPVFYEKNGSNLLNPNMADIWINDVKEIDGTSKIGLPEFNIIDSWMFYSESINDGGNMVLDDMKYSNDITLKVLPVKFNGFTASSSGQGTQLYWENLTEKDVLRYTVERSMDGISFSALGDKPATANNGSKSVYHFTDANPVKGKNFYRIKATEITGKIFYTNTIRINTGDGPKGISLYPNPVTNKKVAVEFSGLSKGTYIITIYNSAQSEQVKRTVEHSGGARTTILELPSSLPAGIYHVMISNGAERYYRMLVVN